MGEFQIGVRNNTQSWRELLVDAKSRGPAIAPEVAVGGGVLSEASRMSSECWCYTTDEGYLLPTLVSASQLRRKLACESGDVIVAYFGAESEVVKRAKEAAKNEDIMMLVLPSSAIEDSPIITARLYLGRILDKKYSFITYLDGDTQVVDAVDALARAVPRSGGILATPDIMAIMIGDQRPQWRDRPAYFRRIGLSDECHGRYFNSGVLKTSRSDWEVISKECLSLLRTSASDDFAFKDQDALNIVLKGNQQLISLRWNWPAFLLATGIDEFVSPHIVHYMSRPRPWDGPFPPWGKSGNVFYSDFVKKYPALSALYRPLGGGRYIRYQAQQMFKGLTEGYGGAAVRERIKSYERNALL